ncbi:2-oxo acid dehydrogenase subunit E2 [Persicimonas caeni]|uniref:2-oxo acid dehydrogenase subunit E2 n=1 Tax=Persicimonas caeni TaxID=2292766 RepID=A0A4Y6PST6_PERCE|nr:2-oxo acid dehydrogenase subunit E2 [Persicimonas caeni]QDG51067.1 2-oxo acid dehydrogenase subunit E2 [Persicimonas caeni]QED32288.1 2-oxo acid dehydrogenase subunit E2 [Persicimonas caeni]
MSLRRKLAIATWASPREGNIYGKLTLDVTEAQRYIEHVRQTTGEKVTVTHLVGKAAAMALKKEPSLNGRILFRRFVPFETVDLSFLVTVEDGADLAKAKVERADEKSVADIAGELREQAGKLRRGNDEQFEKSKGPLKLMPRWMLPRFLWLVGWLTSALGLDLSNFGLDKFPFGSCIITSVGMFGIDEGYAPPTPFARVPVYLLVGAIKEQPTVIDGELAVREQLTITATVDHRFVDGYQLGTLANAFRQVFEDPWSLDGADKPAQLPEGEPTAVPVS